MENNEIVVRETEASYLIGKFNQVKNIMRNADGHTEYHFDNTELVKKHLKAFKTDSALFDLRYGLDKLRQAEADTESALYGTVGEPEQTTEINSNIFGKVEPPKFETSAKKTSGLY